MPEKTRSGLNANPFTLSADGNFPRRNVFNAAFNFLFPAKSADKLRVAEAFFFRAKTMLNVEDMEPGADG